MTSMGPGVSQFDTSSQGQNLGSSTCTEHSAVRQCHRAGRSGGRVALTGSSRGERGFEPRRSREKALRFTPQGGVVTHWFLMRDTEHNCEVGSIPRAGGRRVESCTGQCAHKQPRVSLQVESWRPFHCLRKPTPGSGQRKVESLGSRLARLGVWRKSSCFSLRLR